jgi:hypothetical protein
MSAEHCTDNAGTKRAKAHGMPSRVSSEDVVNVVARATPPGLTRAQLCEILGICRNTLAALLSKTPEVAVAPRTRRPRRGRAARHTGLPRNRPASLLILAGDKNCHLGDQNCHQ